MQLHLTDVSRRQWRKSHTDRRAFFLLQAAGVWLQAGKGALPPFQPLSEAGPTLWAVLLPTSPPPNKTYPSGVIASGIHRGREQVDGNELQVRCELHEKARWSEFHPGCSFHSPGTLLTHCSWAHAHRLGFGWVESSLDANILKLSWRFWGGAGAELHWWEALLPRQHLCMHRSLGAFTAEPAFSPQDAQRLPVPNIGANPSVSRSQCLNVVGLQTVLEATKAAPNGTMILVVSYLHLPISLQGHFWIFAELI